jgi:hypothetical protein
MNEMDKVRKTEIADERIFEVLKQLHQEFDGQFQFESDSDYSSGTIKIKIKD